MGLTKEQKEEEEMMDDWMHVNTMCLRAKWAFDDAESIEEMAGMLRDYADYIESLEDVWCLSDVVSDDYAILERKNLFEKGTSEWNTILEDTKEK